MRKPNSLRAAIATVLPDLARDPVNLKIWLDKGRLVAVIGNGMPAMEYRYELSLLLLDFVGDPNILFAAIVKWLEVEQPDLLLRPLDKEIGLPFEIDIIDDRLSDIRITLELQESVQQGAGGDFVDLQEPDLTDPEAFLAMYDGVPA